MKDVVFFKTQSEFRSWLRKNHKKVNTLWVGYYKVASGKRSITYPESLDEALCFGWIDGLKKGIDDVSYKIRFTPRRPKSIWSKVNIAKVQSLIKQKRMTKAGLEAFSKKDKIKSGVYSFENRNITLDKLSEIKFRANGTAWKFFQSQAPWYKRTSVFWIMSAKKPETKDKRLDILIKDSEERKRINLLSPNSKNNK